LYHIGVFSGIQEKYLLWIVFICFLDQCPGMVYPDTISGFIEGKFPLFSRKVHCGGIQQLRFYTKKRRIK
jgi:hypothetical protein